MSCCWAPFNLTGLQCLAGKLTKLQTEMGFLNVTIFMANKAAARYISCECDGIPVLAKKFTAPNFKPI